jgi:hypothetical protein
MTAGASQCARYNRAASPQLGFGRFLVASNFLLQYIVPERQVRRVQLALPSSPPIALLGAWQLLKSLFWHSKPPASCTEVGRRQPFSLRTSPEPICSCARVLVCMQTNHVSGLHPRRIRRPKQGSKPNGAKGDQQPCLALLTGGSSLRAAKSGVFQTLNDPSLPLVLT